MTADSRPRCVDDPLWKKKSAPTRDQGLSGNSVPFIGSTLSRRYFSQATQFFTVFSMSLDSPGHHTDELAFSRVFVIPW